MDYRKFGNTIIARIDRGEEILETMQKIAQKEQITLANVNALGAIGDITVGVFETKNKVYHANEFQGDYEIVSLTGTITTMNGAYYAHLHLSAGDDAGKVIGGHLNRAVVSATCEMVIQILDGTVEREYSPEIGLNLMKFVD